MGKRYDLAVKVDTYTKNGESKNKWQNIGAVIDGDKGPYILLDRYFNPAGVPNPDNRPNVIVSMFEPKKAEGNYPQQGPSMGGGFDEGPDGIPF